MKSSKIVSTLVFLLMIPLTDLHAQVEKGHLVKGTSMSSEINSNEKHQYKISLKKNQFAFFHLMQKGVDLTVITYDPEGKKTAQFDSPNGRNGPELFTLKSSVKGDYVVEVAPYDENEPTGSYELTVEQIKPKAVSTNQQVDEIFVPWDNHQTAGAAIAVVNNGKIVYKKGYGLANLEYDIPISTDTVFHIASISKQFTVFSILLLEKQGKLSLDDDIRKYLPEVPDFGQTITLRHLATHTSGLRDQWELLEMAGWRMDDVITKEHVLKLVSKQKALNFNPGEEYAYCNTGFTLLAEVVSRVADQSFADFTQANIFEPLKMKHSQFYDDHEKIVKNRAYSYYSDGPGLKKSVLNYANVGATSLFTTVEDLSLWAMNFSELTIGDKAIINKMNTPATLNNGDVFGGALGQFVGEYKGLHEIEHGGADAGYRSYLTRFPDENFAVVVFSNSAEFNSNKIAHEVVDVYLKDKITPPPIAEKVEVDSSSNDMVVDENMLTNYVGVFEVQPGFNITISLNDGQLSAQATGQPIVQLMSLSQTEFQIVGEEAKVEFVVNDENHVESIKIHQGGQIMDAHRAKAFDITAVNLSDYTGKFYSEELSTTYEFVKVDDKLTAKHSRLSDFGLNPTKQDYFSGEAATFRQVEFIRDSNHEIKGINVSNGRVRNLYFEKVK